MKDLRNNYGRYKSVHYKNIRNTLKDLKLTVIGDYNPATFNLNDADFIDALHPKTKAIKQTANEKPLLGICLGLQMLFDWSEENGGTDGLSIFEGTVNHFQSNSLKVPHMGWNTVRQTKEHQLWEGINDNARFYSVHSYYANPSADVEVGSTNYGIDFCSAAARGNIFAVQFHPEKSQRDGLKLLENFVNWQVN